MSSPTDIPQKITITICGDGGCGKSSITLRLVRSQWTHEYDPTIEDSYSLTRRIDGQTYHLSITDTAGQEEYRGMWASSNLKSDAFLLVYDITNRDSLDVLGEFNTLIDIEGETRLDSWENSQHTKKKKGKGKAKDNPPVRPIKIVAGNKCDLQQSRQVSAQVGLRWAKERGCGFMETSARNTVNIEETFALIVRRVVEARRESLGLSVVSGQSHGYGSRSGGLLVGDGGGERINRTSSQPNIGTRRAITAPLTPLPNGPEKELGFPNEAPVTQKECPASKRFWGKLACWR